MVPEPEVNIDFLIEPLDWPIKNSRHTKLPKKFSIPVE